MSKPIYLQNQRIAGTLNNFYHSALDGIREVATPRRLKMSAAITGTAAVLGIAALASDLPKKVSGLWATPSLEDVSGYMSISGQPYETKAGDTVDKLSGGNPLIKEYLMRANGIQDPKKKLKANDIIDVPGTNDETTLREMLSKLPSRK